MKRGQRTLGKLAWLALALAALVNAGCLVAAVGAAAGAAGAAGYMYYNGLLYRDFHANLGDTLLAVRTSLGELQLPVVKEKPDTGQVLVESRTARGDTVRLYLDLVANPVPADGVLTRVSVRVGFAGDEGVSARILDQISKHLTSPGARLTGAEPPRAVPPAQPELLPPRPTPAPAAAPEENGRLKPVPVKP